MSRREDRIANARLRRIKRIVSKLTGGQPAELNELLSTDPVKGKLVLLRLAYRGFKLGVIDANEARLLEARV
jgi:hypothetical protein